ncbi:MAG: PilZ domain-containing protein [Vicinamibacterales bacterium]
MIQERRRTPRYRIDTAIAVDSGTGRTIDLSSNGVYFESQRPQKPGDEVALVFPFEHVGPHASVSCNAQIVRVDARGEQFGIAATYEPVTFSV